MHLLLAVQVYLLLQEGPLLPVRWPVLQGGHVGESGFPPSRRLLVVWVHKPTQRGETRGAATTRWPHGCQQPDPGLWWALQIKWYFILVLVCLCACFFLNVQLTNPVYKNDPVKTRRCHILINLYSMILSTWECTFADLGSLLSRKPQHAIHQSRHLRRAVHSACPTNYESDLWNPPLNSF